MKSKKVRNEGSHQCCLKAKVDKYEEQFCESECNEALMQLLVAQCGGASLALNVSPANQRQLHINSHCKLSSEKHAVKGFSSGETFPIFLSAHHLCPEMSTQCRFVSRFSQKSSLAQSVTKEVES